MDWFEVTLQLEGESLWKNQKEIYPAVDIAQNDLERVIPSGEALEPQEFHQPVLKNPKKRRHWSTKSQQKIIVQLQQKHIKTTQSICRYLLDEKRERKKRSLSVILPFPKPQRISIHLFESITYQIWSFSNKFQVRFNTKECGLIDVDKIFPKSMNGKKCFIFRTILNRQMLGNRGVIEVSMKQQRNEIVIECQHHKVTASLSLSSTNHLFSKHGMATSVWWTKDKKFNNGFEDKFEVG